MVNKDPDKINLQEKVESIKDNVPWHKRPLKIVFGLFLILTILLWLVPYYGVKQNPEPNYTPTLEELNIKINESNIPMIESNNINAYLQTNSQIKRIADLVVTLSCTETHKVCNAKALFYFVKANFNYLNDPLALEYYKTPQETIISKSGDCDDLTILLASLLRSVGFQTRFVFVPGHVYLQVKIPEAVGTYKDDNDWVNLDSTCADCGFGEITYKYSDVKKSYLE